METVNATVFGVRDVVCEVRPSRFGSVTAPRPATIPRKIPRPNFAPVRGEIAVEVCAVEHPPAWWILADRFGRFRESLHSEEVDARWVVTDPATIALPIEDFTNRS